MLAKATNAATMPGEKTIPSVPITKVIPSRYATIAPIMLAPTHQGNEFVRH